MKPSDSAIALELDALHLAYDTKHGPQLVVQDLSLQLRAGDIACLLGPSGCGKTTVLRAIAGFQPLHSGRISLMQREVSSTTLHVPAEQRQIGMVFQDYALFPHLDVAANIAFGLHGHNADQKKLRVSEMLSLVGMSAMGARAPHELSGGQQQRVALARALAPRPQLLLMDEPFSNLDVSLRERLATEVRNLLKETGTTAVIVTHDQHEAFAVADYIAVMSEGRLQQSGTAMALYHEPANRFVAGFIGEGVLLPGKQDETGLIHTELGRFKPDNPPAQIAPLHAIELLVRPDDIQHDDHSNVVAQVMSKAFRGAQFLYTLALPSGQVVQSLVPSHHDHAIGERIGIRVELDHVVCF